MPEAIIVQNKGAFTLRIEGPPSNTRRFAEQLQQLVEAKSLQGVTVEVGRSGIVCCYEPSAKNALVDLAEETLSRFRG